MCLYLGKYRVMFLYYEQINKSVCKSDYEFQIIEFFMKIFSQIFHIVETKRQRMM